MFRFLRIVVNSVVVIGVLGVVAVAGYFNLPTSWLLGKTRPQYADIPYAPDAPRQVLDLYLPLTGKQAYPLVVWVHGGAFKMGDKAGPEQLDALLKAGFAVASLNYRFSDTDRWPAQLDDVIAAVRFLRSEAVAYKIDPKRIALFGASAGGFLVSTAGISMANEASFGVQAVVDWFGPVDFSTMDEDMEASGLSRSTGRNDAADSPESALLGMTVADNHAAASAISPLAMIQKLPQGAQLPAFLIMHGAKDGFVAPRQSERLRDALLAHKGQARVTFELLPDGGHGTGSFKEEGATKSVVSFLSGILRP
jgi:acetyl esterase/lipase